MNHGPTHVLNRAMSAEDVWLYALRDQCARAIAEYLKESVNLQRPIASLSKAEMHGMAQAATSRWIKAVSERIQEVRIIGDSKLPETLEEYKTMLYAG